MTTLPPTSMLHQAVSFSDTSEPVEAISTPAAALGALDLEHVELANDIGKEDCNGCGAWVGCAEVEAGLPNDGHCAGARPNAGLSALTLFGSAGRYNIVEFWLYIVVIAGVSGLSLAILDPDLVRERMRPGCRPVVLRFLPLIILRFAHWAIAGVDRGRLRLSDSGRVGLEIASLLVFALAWLIVTWAMHVNRYIIGTWA